MVGLQLHLISILVVLVIIVYKTNLVMGFYWLKNVLSQKQNIWIFCVFAAASFVEDNFLKRWLNLIDLKCIHKNFNKTYIIQIIYSKFVFSMFSI